jgi:hypothetical protein
MIDERRKQLLEQRDEIDLMLLTDASMSADGAAILKKFEEAEKCGEVSEIPAELDEQCRQLIETAFAKQKRKRTFTAITTYIGKIAVYVLLFLGAASTLVLSVDALRIPVLNFILDQSGRASSLAFDDISMDDKSELDLIQGNVASYIPESYTLTGKMTERNGFALLRYQNNEGDLILIKAMYADGTANIDTENADTTEIDLNGYRAFFVEKDGYCVYWINEEIEKVYSVYADNLAIDLFWKIVYALAA